MFQLAKVDISEWCKATYNWEGQFYEQMPAFVETIATKQGMECEYILVNDEAKITIGAAIVRVKKIPIVNLGVAYIASGPIMCEPCSEHLESNIAGSLEALEGHYVREGKLVLRYRLPISLSLQLKSTPSDIVVPGIDRKDPYQTVLIDLSVDEKELRSGLHAKWRNHLNKSEKFEVDLETGRTRGLVNRFLAVFEAMHDAKQFESTVDPVILHELIDTDIDVHVTILKHEGEDVAGHVTYSSASTSTYVFGASNKKGRDIRAGYKLGWNAMIRSKNMGVRWFDMGGVNREENPMGFEFKTRTGGSLLESIGPIDLYPGKVSKALLNVYENRRKNR